MSKHIQLQIPRSCSEQWQHMHPRTEGRYCDSCQKTVVDFSGMSDAEIIAYFSTNTRPTCGRFAAGQLERDLVPPRRTLPWIKYFFQVSLPAFLLSLKASAQPERALVRTEVLPVRPQEPAAGTVPEPETISGKILDDQGNPVSYATVVIRGSHYGVSADSNGVFILKNVPVPATLSVSCIGFAPSDIRIAPGQKWAFVMLSRQPEEQIFLGAIVVSHRKKKTRKPEAPQKVETLVKVPSILAFPNPVASGSKLKVAAQNLEAGAYRIELYSLSGQLLRASQDSWTGEKSELSIATSGLVPGTYVLRVTCEKSGKGLSQQVVLTN